MVKKWKVLYNPPVEWFEQRKQFPDKIYEYEVHWDGTYRTIARPAPVPRPDDYPVTTKDGFDTPEEARAYANQCNPGHPEHYLVEEYEVQ